MWLNVSSYVRVFFCDAETTFWQSVMSWCVCLVSMKAYLTFFAAHREASLKLSAYSLYVLNLSFLGFLAIVHGFRYDGVALV